MPAFANQFVDIANNALGCILLACTLLAAGLAFMIRRRSPRLLAQEQILPTTAPSNETTSQAITIVSEVKYDPNVHGVPQTSVTVS